MKRILTAVLFFGLINLSYGQDNETISFTEESDTLVKQRFIDRYENIFMTKVPTRHMLKMDMVLNTGVNPNFINSDLLNIKYQLGYEFKVSSDFSVGANVSLKNYNSSFEGKRRIVTAGFLSRWYFDMKRRIRDGKSANNFSGNYVSLIFDKYWEISSKIPPSSKTGLEFGMQRRFLNNGHLDFAIGVFYLNNSNTYAGQVDFFQKNYNDLAIITRANLGLAFGDWKRSHRVPLCDMLRCDEFLGSQWKILWPSLNLGLKTQRATLGFAYEKKLGKAPVSVNTQLLTDYYHLFDNTIFNFQNHSSVSYQIQPSLHLRYYVLQKRKIKRGTGGNNLSGLYLGPYTDFIKMYERLGAWKSDRKHLGVGFIAGYQKRLFKNAYVDVYGEESWNLLHESSNAKSHIGSIRIGFGIAL